MESNQLNPNTKLKWISQITKNTFIISITQYDIKFPFNCQKLLSQMLNNLYPSLNINIINYYSIYYIQSTMSNMNQFYEKIDKAIKQGISEADLTFILEFPQPQQPLGTLFDLPTNSQYILKRFINACMSIEPDIRENSSDALAKWFKKSQVKPNIQKLIKFILDVSNYKKGGNRKSQSQANAAGRILIIKSLGQLFKNNSQIFQSLSQIISDYSQFEIQAIEACHLISFDKILKLKFHSLSPQNKSSRFLYKLFLKTKDPKSEPVKVEDLKEILQIEAQNYPKKSTVLYNIGKYFNTIIDVPMQFFRQYANKYLDNDSQSDVDIHEIYAVLTILKGFLQTNIITQQNYKTHFDKKIISVWLEQFRVLNKKMKSLAHSMSIQFEENNKALAYQILVDLHEQGVYLDNISVNHPLFKLYQWVDAGTYWEYIYNLCIQSDISPVEEQGEQHKRVVMENQKKKNKNTKKKSDKKQDQQTNQQQQTQQQQDPQTFYNQLEHFIKLRFKQLSDEHLCKTIILLLNKFHKNEKLKEILYLCINLLNIICKIPKKRKANGNKQGKNLQNSRLNKKMLIILNKIQLSQVKSLSEDQVDAFKKCILWGKKNTMKIRKEQEYEATEEQIDFFNFYHCMIFFCLIYPDQIQNCSQLQMVHQDLMSFLSKQSEKVVDQPKKKVKKQKKANKQMQPEEAAKPIHVLTDIFISLMTKPPVFLRKAVHYLYEDIIPYLDQTDIANMLTVITTPDVEFIEEI